MRLFSEVPVQKPDFQIGYKDHIFCLGSCFVSETGKRLNEAKFSTFVNPFGTQFHPVAMEHVMKRIYSRIHYTKDEIYHHQGLFFSWDHSSVFSRPEMDKTLSIINHSIETGNEFLHKSDVFIFTLGSAWAYQLRGAEIFVSNCHKVPQQRFNKTLLSFDQVFSAVKNLILMVQDVRPTAKIIFTISPVRHARDGFFENNVSKGVLHHALHSILNEFNEVFYFPSYEIAMDELRDYRFYGEDLMHLNVLGINYIWDKFRAHYFSAATLEVMKEVDKIRLALAHQSQNPGGNSHKSFLYNTLKSAKKLQMQLPEKALAAEIEEIKKRLHAH